jgi:predicted outer membrane lipoprotein
MLIFLELKNYILGVKITSAYGIIKAAKLFELLKKKFNSKRI